MTKNQKKFPHRATATTLPRSERANAFTLAEVLITLVVIGVVASLTLPLIINSYKEQETVVRLKSTVSILSNAIRLAENQNGEMADWGLDGLTEKTSLTLAKYLKPHLKIAKDCGIDDSQGNCISNGNYKRLNGHLHDAYAPRNVYFAYKILLENGSAIFWHGSGAEVFFMIDTNGNKLPNTWGMDLFSVRYSNGRIIPSGSDLYDYHTDCNNMASSGFGCAYYVLSEGKMDYLHKK